MSKSITIRQEKPSDYKTSEQVIKLSFATAEHTDGNEHNLVANLRSGSSFVPELSLVAEVDEKIIGHIMFTKMQMGRYKTLALAPVSVLPEFQKQGVGKKLIETGHKIAKDMGYSFIIVLGSDQYYPKFGYIQAKEFGIIPPFDVPNEFFMAMNLKNQSPTLNKTPTYAKEFGI